MKIEEETELLLKIKNDKKIIVGENDKKVTRPKRKGILTEVEKKILELQNSIKESESKITELNKKYIGIKIKYSRNKNDIRRIERRLNKLNDKMNLNIDLDFVPPSKEELKKHIKNVKRKEKQVKTKKKELKKTCKNIKNDIFKDCYKQRGKQYHAIFEKRTIDKLTNPKSFDENLLNFIKYLHENVNKLNKEVNVYNAQLHFADSFLIHVIKSVHNCSNTEAAQFLKNNNIAQVTPNAIVCNQDKIDSCSFWQMYKNLYDYVTLFTNKIKSKRNKLKIAKNLFATDGTFINIIYKLLMDCLNDTKDEKNVKIKNIKYYKKFLINSVYNITDRMPSSADISTNLSEQQALLRQVQEIPEGSILLGDAHYGTQDIMTNCDENNKFFIFKIGKNIKEVKELISSNKMSDIFTINEVKVKIIKIIKNKTENFLCTNLLDDFYTNEMIEVMYERRWEIEEFFKIIKCSLNLKQTNVKKENTLLQLVYTQMIIAVISRFIEINGVTYLEYVDTPNKKINQNNLIRTVSETLIFKFLYQKCDEKNMQDIKNITFNLINTKVEIEKNRYFARERTRPFTEYEPPGNRYIDNEKELKKEMRQKKLDEKNKKDVTLIEPKIKDTKNNSNEKPKDDNIIIEKKTKVNKNKMNENNKNDVTTIENKKIDKKNKMNENHKNDVTTIENKKIDKKNNKNEKNNVAIIENNIKSQKINLIVEQNINAKIENKTIDINNNLNDKNEVSIIECNVLNPKKNLIDDIIIDERIVLILKRIEKMRKGEYIDF